jgi:hypothetical protein
MAVWKLKQLSVGCPLKDVLVPLVFSNPLATFCCSLLGWIELDAQALINHHWWEWDDLTLLDQSRWVWALRSWGGPWSKFIVLAKERWDDVLGSGLTKLKFHSWWLSTTWNSSIEDQSNKLWYSHTVKRWDRYVCNQHGGRMRCSFQ